MKSKIILGTAAICIIIAAGSSLFGILSEYRRGNAAYEEFRQEIFPPESTSEEEKTESGANPETAERLRSCMKENENMKGYLQFDTLSIRYPIMQGTDNEYYLTHTYDGQRNSAGSIFMEAGNTGDFQDLHTILYGHNMKNGTMFGQLKKYRQKAFWENNPYFSLYTKDRYARYRIFAVRVIEESDKTYRIGFAAIKDYGRLISTMQKTSLYDTGVHVTVSDRILTLSTCTDRKNQRLTVHGVLEEEIIDKGGKERY